MQKIKDKEHWEKGDFIKLINSLSKDDAKKRHDIRYALFRVKNQLDGNVPAEKIHWDIAETIQKHPNADALNTFAVTWDVGAVSPEINVVKRMWSIHQEHNQMMKRIAVPVTKSDTSESLALKAKIIEDREAKRFARDEKRKQKMRKGVK